MPKRRKHPDLSDARSWLSHLAAAEGIDLEHLSLAEAVDRAVSQLEQQRDAGVPLRPGAVQFAALLLRIEGQMVVAGASSAEPFIERAYALDRARLLAERHAAGQRVWTRPEIPLPGMEPDPEPEPEPAVTLYDLIRICESLMHYCETAPGRPRPIVSALSRNNSGSVARIVVPVAAIKRNHSLSEAIEVHSGPCAVEIRRRERLDRNLQLLLQTAHSRRTPVAAGDRALELVSTRFRNLPPGVDLSPSQLTIDFNGTKDFLEKVGAVVFALQNDYEAVSEFIENTAIDVQSKDPYTQPR